MRRNFGISKFLMYVFFFFYFLRTGSVYSAIIVSGGSSPTYWEIIDNGVEIKRAGTYYIYENSGGDIAFIRENTSAQGTVTIRILNPNTGDPGARNIGYISFSVFDANILNSTITGNLGTSGYSYMHLLDSFNIRGTLQRGLQVSGTGSMITNVYAGTISTGTSPINAYAITGVLRADKSIDAPITIYPGNINKIESGFSSEGQNADIKGTISAPNISDGIYIDNDGSLLASINVTGTIGKITLNGIGNIGTSQTSNNITAGTISNIKVNNGSAYANFTVGTMNVGNDNDTFKLAGGTSTITNLYIANTSGKTGTLDLEGGTLTVSGNISDGAGTSSLYLDGGTLNMSGSTGSITVDNLTVGYHSGKTGSYTLSGSKQLKVNSSAVIGSSGTGTFNLGNTTTTGTLTQDGTAANLTVQENNGTSGTFTGWGTVGLTGTLKNNGKIQANGFGTNRDLDLTNFSSIDNTYDNLTTSGTNGWFAINHGQLKLPNVNVDNATSYNWGEAPGDGEIDLVNSVRLAFSNVTTAGTVSGKLLAKDRTSDLPAFPSGCKIIGVWNFTPTNLVFGTVGLTFRYDDAMASTLGITENDLQVLYYNGSSWTRVSRTLDTSKKQITATGLTSLGYYAVGTAYTLSGTVDLQDYPPGENGISVNVQLQNQADMSVTTRTATLNTSGQFTLTGIAAGTYNVRVKASHWLAKVQEGVVVSGDTTMSTPFSLLNGDVDGDNEVTSDDLTFLNAALGSMDGDENWDARCDLDGDGEVTSDDLTYLNTNLGQIGDEFGFSSHISGTVDLQDYPPGENGISVNVQLQNQADMSVTTRTATLNASGQFTLTGVAAGTYNARVKASHWLAKVQAGVVVSGDTTIPASFSLLNGDCNNDNIIEENDFGLMSSDWYNEPPTIEGTDLNGDGVVEENDYGILSAHWYLEGDEISSGFSVTGTVDLQDWTGPNNDGDPSGINVLVKLQNQTTMSISTHAATLDADGHFAVTGIVTGTYNVRIKASHWLAKVQEGLVVSGDTTISTPFSLINGDAIDNNEVDWDDFNLVNEKFGTFIGEPDWDPRADLDKNGEVDYDDFNIVTNNFGFIGDEF